MDYVDITEKIKKRGDEISGDLIEIRRWIHQHPELSGKEYETSKFIAEKLEEMGLEPQTGIAETGVVTLIKGGKEGRTIAFRADMDALPITEKNDVPYKSENPGVMHACGHDTHVTNLLGVAMILIDPEIRAELPGSVKLIFQPSEEKFPGGALRMIEEGVLENPKVEAIIAAHAFPFLDAGKIGLKDEIAMAAIDDFEVEISGDGCHASTPHLGTDAIVAASHCIMAIQTIISRKISPLQSAVISIGMINGGTKSNILAEEVMFKGTIRTLDPEIRVLIKKMLEETIRNSVETLGCGYTIRYIEGYDAVFNDPGINKICGSSISKILGEESFEKLQEPMMGSEDFSYFSSRLPATVMRIGSKSPDRKFYPLHHNMFDVDESILPLTAKVFAQVAFDSLENYNNKK